MWSLPVSEKKKSVQTELAANWDKTAYMDSKWVRSGRRVSNEKEEKEGGGRGWGTRRKKKEKEEVKEEEEED